MSQGVLYSAEIVPLGVTACVISMDKGSDKARVECVLSDMLQLREQLNLYDAETFEGLEMGDEDDDVYRVEGGGGGAEVRMRTRARE